MPRFTIRDLLWSTAVVGIVLAWYVDRTRLVQPLILTRKPLDFAIDGDGFFCVTDEQTASTAFTRYGHFTVNENDLLALVLDGKEWLLSPAVQIPPDAISIMINANGLIVAQLPSTDRPTPVNPKIRTSEIHFVPLGQIQLALFNDSLTLRQTARLTYIDTNKSGQPNLTNPGENGAGSIRQGVLEKTTR